MYKGVDVSQWQGAIDWKKVATDGIDFAILRSIKGNLSVDPYFEKNFTGAKSNGLAIGVYKYSYATTVAAAKAEADAVVKLLNGRKLEAKVWLDLEDKCQESLDKNLFYDIVKTFLETVSAAGYEVGIYCNQNWYKNILTNEVKGLTKNWWIAKWSDEKPNLGEIGWQYSSTGHVNGINGNVDMDYYYVEYDNIQPEESKIDVATQVPEISEPKNTEQVKAKFSEGDIVKVKNAVQYDNGEPFKCWYTTYEVIKVGEGENVNRIVIGKGKVTTAAVHADNLVLASSESATVVESPLALRVGDKVKVINAVQYDNGKSFKLWYPTYDVISVGEGDKIDRIVIGIGAVKTAAVHRNNLQKV